MNRVFITGLGVVSPIGSSVPDYWQSMLQESKLPDQVLSDLSQLIDNRYIYTCQDFSNSESTGGRTQVIAIDAVAQAISDSGLEGPQLNGGVLAGTTLGEEPLLERSRLESKSGCSRKDYPFQLSAAIAQRFGWCGPNMVVSNACTSGLYSIDIAANAIRHGDAELMIAGGVETVSRVVLGCFNRMGALDKGACRPFDVDRNGTVLAEGAAFLILESEEHINRRGFTDVYCEYKGSGWSCDAYQPTAPEPGGEQIEKALRDCLESSSVEAEEVDCIIPHGTGTPLNDAVEAKILTNVFGKNTKLPVLTAIKSKQGHSGGASGAFSVVTACLILRDSMIPPTANLKHRDDSFALPIPVEAPLKQRTKNVVVNAYAFGGNNISVMLGLS